MRPYKPWCKNQNYNRGAIGQAKEYGREVWDIPLLVVELTPWTNHSENKT